MNEKGEVVDADQFTVDASGYVIGKDIYLRKSESIPKIFMVLFHEIGHIIQNQTDFRNNLRPAEQIKSFTISFSPEELNWLIHQLKGNFSDTGITPEIISITKKIIQGIVKDDTDLDYEIHEADDKSFVERLNNPSSNLTTNGQDESYATSDLTTNEQGETIVKDVMLRRNREVPADYVLTAGYDILNRSLSKLLKVSPPIQFFTFTPDEITNARSTKIAQFLYNRNWEVPDLS